MTEWKHAIWLAVSAMLTALVLGYASTLGSFGRQQAAIQNEQDNAIAIVKEYRKFNQYDGTVLYPQDVISAIAEMRGMPIIRVDIVDGASTNFAWEWNTSTPAANFSTTYLSGVFPVGGTYTAYLVKNTNGEIARIDFYRN